MFLKIRTGLHPFSCWISSMIRFVFSSIDIILCPFSSALLVCLPCCPLFLTFRAIFWPARGVRRESEGLPAFPALSGDVLHRLVFRSALLAAIRPVLDIFREGESLSAYLTCSCYHPPLRCLRILNSPGKQSLKPLKHWTALLIFHRCPYILILSLVISHFGASTSLPV